MKIELQVCSQDEKLGKSPDLCTCDVDCPILRALALEAGGEGENLVVQ